MATRIITYSRYGAKNAKVYTLCHLAGVSVYVGYQLYNVISNLYSMWAFFLLSDHWIIYFFAITIANFRDVIFMVPSAYMGGAKEQFWNVSLCSDLRYCRRENQNKQLVHTLIVFNAKWITSSAKTANRSTSQFFHTPIYWLFYRHERTRGASLQVSPRHIGISHSRSHRSHWSCECADNEHQSRFFSKKK